MNPLKKQAWALLNTLGMGGAIQLYLKSAPKQYGWFQSFHTKRSVDAAGNALPWYTYPFIAFLKPRLNHNLLVFEYGSGNSTRWYADRVKHITAVEHDETWAGMVAPQLPTNTTLLPRSLGDAYVQSAAEQNERYHIIIVDGRQRVECVLFSADYLSPDGVLILDNSEREIYREARTFLQQHGFRSLDFFGMTPIISDESCTSVFYRSGNCLDI